MGETLEIVLKLAEEMGLKRVSLGETISSSSDNVEQIGEVNVLLPHLYLHVLSLLVLSLQMRGSKMPEVHVLRNQWL